MAKHITGKTSYSLTHLLTSFEASVTQTGELYNSSVFTVLNSVK